MNTPMKLLQIRQHILSVDTSSLANLEGLEEYHDGKSNTISGIEMPDGRKCIVQ